MKILSKILVFSFFLLSTFYFLSSPSFVHAASPTVTPIKSNIVTSLSNTSPDVPPRNPVPTENVAGTFQPQADYVPNNPHFSTQSTVIEVMSAIVCQLSGIDPVNPKQSCLGVDQKSGKIGFLARSPTPNGAGGAIGAMGNMITMLYTPPLHTGDYFQNLAQDFGITKKTYAQQTGLPAGASAQAGTGFDGLKPLLGLWTAFRNIAYMVFVIVFVIIGLAVMLRIKIDPRTVMTIQNQIPKIIIGILLVTFSYAISGFLIDMMYVSIHLIGNTLSAHTQNEDKSALVQNVANASDPFHAVGTLFDRGVANGLGNLAWKPAQTVVKPIAALFDNIPGRLITGIAGYILGSQIKKIAQATTEGVVGTINALGQFATFIGILAAPATGGASLLISATPLVLQNVGKVVSGAIGGAAAFALAPQIVGLFFSLVVFLIILIALLVALFRLWLALLIAYVHILLDVVLAPFWIIGGIVPGSPISIGGWLRDIGANILAFPVTIAMFLLGKVFIDAFTCDATVQTCKDALMNNFVPPLIGNRLDSEGLGALIGLGVILITPNIINILKTALKAPKTDTGLGKAIGVGSPSTIFNKAGQIALSATSIGSGVRALPVVKKLFPQK